MERLVGPTRIGAGRWVAGERRSRDVGSMRVDPAEDVCECGVLRHEVARCCVCSSEVGYDPLVCDLRELLRQEKVSEGGMLLWTWAYVRFSRPYQAAIALQQDCRLKVFGFAGSRSVH